MKVTLEVLLDEVVRWQEDGHRVALARVVDAVGPGPHELGAAIAVSDDGDVVGSLSGVCVEGAVVSIALQVAESGLAQLCSFSCSHDDPFSPGLTCGGSVMIFIEPLTDGETGLMGGRFGELRDCVRAGEQVTLATVLDVVPDRPATSGGNRSGEAASHGDPPAPGSKILIRPGTAALGSFGQPELDESIVVDANDSLAAGRSALRVYRYLGSTTDYAVRVFHHTIASPPQIVIVGASGFATALTRVAKALGYRTTVCDPRQVFATISRFPDADEVVADWPDRVLAALGDRLGPRDAVCILSHDSKIDDPAIIAALGTRVGYIGVIGSRQTHAQRISRLGAEGIPETELVRLMAPIGLDIGARTPEETAIAIMAEVIALRAHRPVPSLRDAAGPIHRTPG